MAKEQASEEKSTVEVSNTPSEAPKKKMFQKWWFWILVLVILGFIVYYSGLI
jgi:hypothetical protein